MKRYEFYGKYANMPVKDRNKECTLTWDEVYELLRENVVIGSQDDE